MSRTENVELTVLCLLHKDDAYLLQDRIKKDWQGYTNEFQYVIEDGKWMILKR